jgi:hypothetical protein
MTASSIMVEAALSQLRASPRSLIGLQLVVVALVRGLGAHPDGGADLSPGRAVRRGGERERVAAPAGLFGFEVRCPCLIEQLPGLRAERASGAGHPPITSSQPDRTG